MSDIFIGIGTLVHRTQHVLFPKGAFSEARSDVIHPPKAQALEQEKNNSLNWKTLRLYILKYLRTYGK